MTEEQSFDIQNTYMIDKGILTFKKGTKKLLFLPEPVDLYNVKSQKVFE